jgi:hypothetical protein
MGLRKANFRNASISLPTVALAHLGRRTPEHLLVLKT